MGTGQSQVETSSFLDINVCSTRFIKSLRSKLKLNEGKKMKNSLIKIAVLFAMLSPAMSFAEMHHLGKSLTILKTANSERNITFLSQKSYQAMMKLRKGQTAVSSVRLVHSEVNEIKSRRYFAVERLRVYNVRVKNNCSLRLEVYTDIYKNKNSNRTVGTRTETNVDILCPGMKGRAEALRLHLSDNAPE